jgi:hypothetical protein
MNWVEMDEHIQQTMQQKYAAVILLSNTNGSTALATHAGAIIVGSRQDIHKLFGSLLVQLVPISSKTTVQQIEAREHAPEVFAKGSNAEALFQGGSLHGTYEKLAGKPDEIIRGNEVYRLSPLANGTVYRYAGDVG